MSKAYFNFNHSDWANNIDYWKSYMAENNLKELELTLAEKEKDSDFFLCKKVMDVGEKGNCGKICDFYDPRNGKSGICKHYSNNIFEETDEKKIIKI